MVQVHAVDTRGGGGGERIVVTGRLVAAMSIHQVELHGMGIGGITIVEPTAGYTHIRRLRMPARVGRVD